MSTLLVRTAPPARRGTSAGPFSPAADIVRDGDDALVRVEIAGIDPEQDVTVELTGRQLVIRGERRDEQTRESGGRTLRELRYGSFRRSFGVPRNVNAEAITATYDAGVLSVRLAGAYAGSEPQRIAVTAPEKAVSENPASETAASDKSDEAAA